MSAFISILRARHGGMGMTVVADEASVANRLTSSSSIDMFLAGAVPRGTERRYTFTSVEQLIADFIAAVDSARRKT